MGLYSLREAGPLGEAGSDPVPAHAGLRLHLRVPHGEDLVRAHTGAGAGHLRADGAAWTRCRCRPSRVRPPSRWTWGEVPEMQHTVDTNLLIQDSHIHIMMYAIVAALLTLIILGLDWPAWWRDTVIVAAFCHRRARLRRPVAHEARHRRVRLAHHLSGLGMSLVYLIVLYSTVRALAARPPEERIMTRHHARPRRRGARRNRPPDPQGRAGEARRLHPAVPPGRDSVLRPHGEHRQGGSGHDPEVQRLHARPIRTCSSIWVRAPMERAVGVTLFQQVDTPHGPIEVGLTFGPDGALTSADVTTATVETKPWVQEATASGLMKGFAGLPLGRRPAQGAPGREGAQRDAGVHGRADRDGGGAGDGVVRDAVQGERDVRDDG